MDRARPSLPQMRHAERINDTLLVEAADGDFEWMINGKPQGRSGLRLPPGGVDDDFVLKMVRIMAQQLRAQNCNGAWMITSGDEVVGLCSYRRPPSGGEVEIGYGVAQSRRGRSRNARRPRHGGRS